MLKIGLRLTAMAAMIPSGMRVADIGCDHGKLSIALAKKNVQVIASDVSAPSLDKTIRRARLEAVDHLLQIRLGDGLSVLKSGEVDIIVLAGMSGYTQIGIMERGLTEVMPVQALILQPMQDVESLRRWLPEHGWRIDCEDLVWEKQRYFFIIKARPGQSPLLSPAQVAFGPCLMQQKHPLLKNYLHHWMEVLGEDLLHIPQDHPQRKEQESHMAMCREVEHALYGSEYTAGC